VKFGKYPSRSEPLLAAAGDAEPVTSPLVVLLLQAPASARTTSATANDHDFLDIPCLLDIFSTFTVEIV
jgi:hypothetical protein